MRNINFLFISPRYREVETPRADRTCGIKRVIRARCYISLCVWVSLKRVNRAGISDDPHFENAVLIKRWWILNRPFVGSLRSGDEAAPIRQSPIGFVGKRRLESSTATMARREIRSVASRWKTRRKKRKEKEKDKEAKRKRRLLLLPENKVVLVTRGKSWRNTGCLRCMKVFSRWNS